MTITPLNGYIVDPNNPNGVIRDPNVATTPGGYTPSTQPTSTAFGAVNSQPVVTPNASGSLQNTLQTPTAPVTPPVPQGGAQPTQTQSNTQTAPGAGLDPTAFSSVLEGIKNNYATSNALIDSKNLLLKGLFTSPLTPDEIAKLPPDIAQVYNSGNKDAIELQLQALNGQIQGGTNNFANSVNYLVNGYQTSVQQAEQQKNDAISTVQNFVQQYGSKAGAALTSLYGPGYVDTLKNMGINIDQFAATPTLAETAANLKASSGSGSGDAVYISDNDPTTVDPGSQSILAQTGLSVLAFNYLTQGTTALSRLSASDRQAVFKEAEDFLNKSGIDYSTFQSQYKAQNSVLQSNVERAANTKVFAGEVSGTAQQFINDVGSDIGNLKPATVAQLFATGQTNDKTAQKYAFDLQTMQNDLAGYYAASRGANSPDQSDLAAAAKVITQGLSGQGAQAFKDSIDANEKKVSSVVNNAVTDAQKSIWTQFGVGDKYKSPADTSNPSTLPADVQALVQPNLTLDDTKKIAYIPRAIWSTLGSNMDAVIADIKNSGYTLLVKD